MKIIAASYLLPVATPPVEGGALVVDNGRIVALGKLSDMQALYSSPVKDFPGCVIMPGFVNAHTHLELTHFPSWKIRKSIDYSPRTYVDWVIQVIKINRSLTGDEREHSLREGIRISLESGTTAVGDILTEPKLLYLYENQPLIGRIFLEAIGRDPVLCQALLERLENNLVSFPVFGMLPGLSPHTPHTVSETFLKDLAQLAEKKCVPMTIHVAEPREEIDFFFNSTGKIVDLLYPHVGWEKYIPPPQKTTPVFFLDRLGILGPGTTAIHCVHITAAEAELLKKNGVHVVICPRSNDKLDVGKAPLHLMKKYGIPIGLGTDSLASNDSLSLEDEMRFLWSNFPGLFTADEVLHMATLGGAGAIGLARETGSLEVGKRADFLVMGLDRIPSARDLSRAVLEQGKLMEVAPGGDFLHFK